MSKWCRWYRVVKCCGRDTPRYIYDQSTRRVNGKTETRNRYIGIAGEGQARGSGDKGSSRFRLSKSHDPVRIELANKLRKVSQSSSYEPALVLAGKDWVTAGRALIDIQRDASGICEYSSFTLSRLIQDFGSKPDAEVADAVREIMQNTSSRALRNRLARVLDGVLTHMSEAESKKSNDTVVSEATDALPDDPLDLAANYASADDFIAAQGISLFHTTDKEFKSFDPAFAGTQTEYLGGGATEGFFFADNMDTIGAFKAALARGVTTFRGQTMDGRDTSNFRVIEKIVPKDKFMNLHDASQLSDKDAEILSAYFGTESGETLKGSDAVAHVSQVFDDLAPGVPLVEDMAHLTRHLKKKGYEGVVTNMGGGTNEYVVFDPNKFKTREELAGEWQAANKRKTSSASIREPLHADIKHIAAMFGGGYDEAEKDYDIPAEKMDLFELAVKTAMAGKLPRLPANSSMDDKREWWAQFNVERDTGGIRPSREERKEMASKLQRELAHFSGTEDWHRALNRRVTFTDGVKHFVTTAGANWFVDIVSTEVEDLVKKHGFVSVTASAADNKAILTAKHNNDVLWTRDIELTDLPDGEWNFFMAEGGPDNTTVLMLPGEY